MSRRIDHIVIHCSATPNGRAHRATDIDRWHQARGFRRVAALIPVQTGTSPAASLRYIGYHFVIGLDGRVEPGRTLIEAGAHVMGHNARSIGICLIGTDRFTTAQWTALHDLIEQLRDQFPKARVVGHRDLSPDRDGDGKIETHEWLKICPGFEVSAWLSRRGVPDPQHVLMPIPSENISL